MAAVMDVPVEPSKKTKLSRACDACRRLRRKCNDTVPCNCCASRNIPCTFEIPWSKRGKGKRTREAEASDDGGAEEGKRPAKKRKSLSRKTIPPEEAVAASASDESLMTMLMLSQAQGSLALMQASTRRLYLDMFFQLFNPMLTVVRGEPMYTLYRALDGLQDNTAEAISAPLLFQLHAIASISGRALGHSLAAQASADMAHWLAVLCYGINSLEVAAAYFIFYLFYLGHDNAQARLHGAVALAITRMLFLESGDGLGDEELSGMLFTELWHKLHLMQRKSLGESSTAERDAAVPHALPAPESPAAAMMVGGCDCGCCGTGRRGAGGGALPMGSRTAPNREGAVAHNPFSAAAAAAAAEVDAVTAAATVAAAAEAAVVLEMSDPGPCQSHGPGSDSGDGSSLLTLRSPPTPSHRQPPDVSGLLASIFIDRVLGGDDDSVGSASVGSAPAAAPVVLAGLEDPDPDCDLDADGLAMVDAFRRMSPFSSHVPGYRPVSHSVFTSTTEPVFVDVLALTAAPLPSPVPAIESLLMEHFFSSVSVDFDVPAELSSLGGEAMAHSLLRCAGASSDGSSGGGRGCLTGDIGTIDAVSGLATSFDCRALALKPPLMLRFAVGDSAIVTPAPSHAATPPPPSISRGYTSGDESASEGVAAVEPPIDLQARARLHIRTLRAVCHAIREDLSVGLPPTELAWGEQTVAVEATLCASVARAHLILGDRDAAERTAVMCVRGLSTLPTQALGLGVGVFHSVLLSLCLTSAHVGRLDILMDLLAIFSRLAPNFPAVARSTAVVAALLKREMAARGSTRSGMLQGGW